MPRLQVWLLITVVTIGLCGQVLAVQVRPESDEDAKTAIAEPDEHARHSVPDRQSWANGRHQATEESLTVARFCFFMGRMNEIGAGLPHTVEVFVRSRPTTEFSDMSEQALVSALLVFIAKQVSMPFGRDATRTGVVVALPRTSSFSTRVVYLPYDQLGDFWFGGDWIGGSRDEAGSLWVIVADVTGHGYPAYLVASGLPYVWEMCLNGEHALERPAQLLSALHSELAICLPDGVFVEATVAKCGSDGAVTIAAAGGGRVFMRSSDRGETSLLTVCGGWLGLMEPDPNDERQINLVAEDEVVLSSDGFLDQLALLCGQNAQPLSKLQELSIHSSLETAAKTMLDDSLRDHRQIDDISLVAVKRQL